MTNTEQSRSSLRITILGVLTLILLGVSPAWAQGQWTTNGNNISNTNTGNVGIGTASPGNKLDVAPGAGDGIRLRSTGSDTNTSDLAITNRGISVTTSGWTLPNTFAATFGNPSWQSGGDSGGVLMTVAHTLDNNTNSLLTLYNRNQAGFEQHGYFLKATGASSSDKFWLKAGGSAFFAGNVGLGATAPLQRLQIGSNTATGTATPDAISLGATYSTVAGANPKLRLFDNNAGSVYGLGVSASQFDFMIPAGTRYVWSVNGTEKMRLDDLGNITVSGNIAAKYQDVAEWVPSAQALSPGTVVIVDPAKSNHVMSSSQAYDTRVAGVISAQPGLTLGESGAGKVLVATTGRVRIKVDARSAPIQIGDLLVTSDIEGLAMKSEPLKVGGRLMHMPGTLVGKALEPLEKGTGEILVLLSLQ